MNVKPSSLQSVIGSGLSNKPRSIGGMSFGQVRANRIQARLDRSIQARQKMFAMENAGNSSFNEFAKQKGQLLERQIDRLIQQNKSRGK